MREELISHLATALKYTRTRTLCFRDIRRRIAAGQDERIRKKKTVHFNKRSTETILRWVVGVRGGAWTDGGK